MFLLDVNHFQITFALSISVEVFLVNCTTKFLNSFSLYRVKVSVSNGKKKGDRNRKRIQKRRNRLILVKIFILGNLISLSRSLLFKSVLIILPISKDKGKIPIKIIKPPSLTGNQSKSGYRKSRIKISTDKRNLKKSNLL